MIKNNNIHNIEYLHRDPKTLIQGSNLNYFTYGDPYYLRNFKSQVSYMYSR